jgi:hypothetical protein
MFYNHRWKDYSDKPTHKDCEMLQSHGISMLAVVQLHDFAGSQDEIGVALYKALLRQSQAPLSFGSSLDFY